MMLPDRESNWLQDLRNWENNPAPGGPEPTPGDWDRLAAKMQKKKRRRFWWLPHYLGAALLFLVLSSDQFKLTPPVSSEKEVTTAAHNDTAEGQNEVSRKVSGPLMLDAEAADSTSDSRAEIALRTAVGKEEDKTDSPKLLSSSMVPPQLSKHPIRNIDAGLPILTSPAAKVETRRAEPIRLLPRLDHRLAEPAMLSLEKRSRPVSSVNRIPGSETNLLQTAGQLGLLRLETNAPNSSDGSKWWAGVSTQIGRYFASQERQRFRNPSLLRQRVPYLALGLNVQYEFSPRLRLESGLFRSKDRVTTRQRWQRTYTPEDEQPSATDAGFNSYAIEVDGAYGKTAAEIEVVRPVGRPLERELRLQFETQLVEEVKRTTIPLVLSYAVPVGERSRIAFGAGLLWQRQEVVISQSTRLLSVAGFRLGRRRSFSREVIRRDRAAAGQLQLGFEHFISPDFQLSLAAFYQGGRTSELTGVQQEYFHRSGLQLKAQQRF